MYISVIVYKVYFHIVCKTNLISKYRQSVSARNIMENQSEKIIKINCVLQGDVAARFLEIKKRKGIENNTEAIRLAISEYYEAITKGT
jgi:hypothetical protein